MSKRAEELAVEYQIKTHGPNVMGGANVLSEDEYMRLNMNYDFKAGYELAEKNLALTWEDMHKIVLLTSKVSQEFTTDNTREVYEEVLRRFNEYKEGKK